MAESGQIRAVFSTKFGRLGYKEARQPVRCIIRSEYWDDVHEMAKSLQKDFPECCDSMTMREVHRLHYYFDPHDIQMHSESFLIHVLELLVCWNYLGSIHRIHDFAAHWTAANPKAYEDVAFNAQVTDVFSKIEIETLGDDFLSSVLNILIQSRFPEGWEIMVEDFRRKQASQSPLLPLSWLEAKSPNASNEPRRSTSDPILAEKPTRNTESRNEPPLLSAPLEKSAVRSTSESFRRGPYMKPAHAAAPIRDRRDTMPVIASQPGMMIPAISDLSGPPPRFFGGRELPQMFPSFGKGAQGNPLGPPNEVLERIHPGSTSRGDFHSDPMTVTWQDRTKLSTNLYAIPSKGRPGPYKYTFVPLSARKREPQPPTLGRGVRNPPKRSSDDIRLQMSISASDRHPSGFEQSNWVPAFPDPMPPVSAQETANFPHAPVLTRSIEHIPQPVSESSQGVFTVSRGQSNAELIGQHRSGTAHGPRTFANNQMEPPMYYQQGLQPQRFVSNPFEGTDPSFPADAEPPRVIAPGSSFADENRAAQLLQPADATHMPPLQLQSNFGPPSSQPLGGNYHQEADRMQSEQAGTSREPLAHMTNSAVSGSEKQGRPRSKSFNSLHTSNDCQLFIRGFPPHFKPPDVAMMLQPCRGLISFSPPRSTRRIAHPEVLYVFAKFGNSDLAAEALEKLPRTYFPDVQGCHLHVSWKRDPDPEPRTPNSHRRENPPERNNPTLRTPKSDRSNVPHQNTEVAVSPSHRRSGRRDSGFHKQGIEPFRNQTSSSKGAEGSLTFETRTKDGSSGGQKARGSASNSSPQNDSLAKHQQDGQAQRPLNQGSEQINKKKDAGEKHLPKPGQARHVNSERGLNQKVQTGHVKTSKNSRKESNIEAVPDHTQVKSMTNKGAEVPEGPPLKSSKGEISKTKQIEEDKTPNIAKGSDMNDNGKGKHQHTVGKMSSIDASMVADLARSASTVSQNIAPVSPAVPTPADTPNLEQGVEKFPEANVHGSLEHHKSHMISDESAKSFRPVPKMVAHEAETIQGKHAPNYLQHHQLEGDKENAAGISLDTKTLEPSDQPQSEKDLTAGMESQAMTRGNSTQTVATADSTKAVLTPLTPPSPHSIPDGSLAAIGSHIYKEEHKPPTIAQPSSILETQATPRVQQVDSAEKSQPPNKAMQVSSDDSLDGKKAGDMLAKSRKQTQKQNRKRALQKTEPDLPSQTGLNSTTSEGLDGKSSDKRAEEQSNTEPAEESKSPSHSMETKSEDALNMVLGAAAKNLDKSEPPEIPPRSSSLQQSPIPGPIITRKKKQRNFGSGEQVRSPQRTDAADPATKKVGLDIMAAVKAPTLEHKTEESARDRVEEPTLDPGPSDLKGHSKEAKNKNKKGNRKKDKSATSQDLSIDVTKAQEHSEQKHLPAPETPYVLDTGESRGTRNDIGTNSTLTDKGKAKEIKDSPDRLQTEDGASEAQRAHPPTDPFDQYYQKKRPYMHHLQKAMKHNSAGEISAETPLLPRRPARPLGPEIDIKEFARMSGYNEPLSSQNIESEDPALARIDMLFESEAERVMSEEILQKAGGHVILPMVNGKAREQDLEMFKANQAKMKIIQDAKAMRDLQRNTSQRSSSPQHSLELGTGHGLEEELDKVAAELTLAAIRDGNFKPEDISADTRRVIQRSRELLDKSPRRNTSRMVSPQDEKDWDHEAREFLARHPRQPSGQILRFNFSPERISSNTQQAALASSNDTTDAEHPIQPEAKVGSHNPTEDVISRNSSETTSIITPGSQEEVGASELEAGSDSSPLANRSRGRSTMVESNAMKSTMPSKADINLPPDQHAEKLAASENKGQGQTREQMAPSSSSGDQLHLRAQDDQARLTQNIKHFQERKRVLQDDLTRLGAAELNISSEELDVLLVDIEKREKDLKGLGEEVSQEDAEPEQKLEKDMSLRGGESAGHLPDSDVDVMDTTSNPPDAPFSESSRTVSAEPEERMTEDFPPSEAGDQGHRSSVIPGLGDVSPTSFPQLSSTPSDAWHRAPLSYANVFSSTSGANRPGSVQLSPQESVRGSFEATKGGFRGGVRGKTHMHSKSDPWAVPGEEGQWGNEKDRERSGSMPTQRRASAGGSPSHKRVRGSNLRRMTDR